MSKDKCQFCDLDQGVRLSVSYDALYWARMSVRVNKEHTNLVVDKHSSGITEEQSKRLEFLSQVLEIMEEAMMHNGEDYEKND